MNPVAIFIPSLRGGGAERVTANLANHWANKGLRITAVKLASIYLYFYQLHPSVLRISLGVAGESSNALEAVANNLRRIRALRRVLKHTKPGTVLAMMSTANSLLALAAIGLKNIKTIGSEHIYPPHIPLGRAWEILRA